jgi:hypothetical protein
MGIIDVSDIDIYTLILALWEDACIASFFAANFMTPTLKPSIQEIDRILEHSKYIDYLAGRCFKTDFSDMSKVKTDMYNRDAGPDKFENIVKKLYQDPRNIHYSNIVGMYLQ